MGLRVRVAEPPDAAAIADVINRAYVVERELFIGDRTSADEVSANIATRNVEYLIAESAEAPPAIVGAVYVEFRGDRAYFGPFAVSPDHQRRGAGKLLVHALEDRCRALSCRHLDMTIVDVRTELLPFYESLGFAKSGVIREYHHPERALRPLRLVEMTKEL